MRSQATRQRIKPGETRSATADKVSPRLPGADAGSADGAACLCQRPSHARPGLSVLRPPLPWRVLTGLSLVLLLLATIVTAVMAMIGFSGLKPGRRGSRWRDGHSRLILMRKCTTNVRASTSTLTSMPASAVKNLLTAKSATACGRTQAGPRQGGVMSG